MRGKLTLQSVYWDEQRFSFAPRRYVSPLKNRYTPLWLGPVAPVFALAARSFVNASCAVRPSFSILSISATSLFDMWERGMAPR